MKITNGLFLKTLRSIVVLSLFFAGSFLGFAEDLNRITKSYPLPEGDMKELKELVQGMASPTGKVILVETRRLIILQDRPSVHEEVAALLKSLNVPVANVRIELKTTETGDDRANEFGLKRRGIILKDELSGADALNSQFLVTRSGGSASMSIGRDVPLVDYFWSYASQLGLIEQNTIRWQHIGSRLSIEPVVQGNLITVKLVPEITSLDDPFNASVRFINLATTITIADGGSFDIGGLDKADEKFNRNFFYRGSESGKRVTSIRLSASILKPQ